jgi:hypothetical protein
MLKVILFGSLVALTKRRSNCAILQGARNFGFAKYMAFFGERNHDRNGPDLADLVDQLPTIDR